MGMKAAVKRLLGRKGLGAIRTLKAYKRYFATRRNAGRLELRSDDWAEPVVYSLPEEHVFFGYYDLQQLSPGGDKLLVTTVPRKAVTGRDSARLRWVDVVSGQFHDIAATRAWCWQQGSRLRWHPTLPDTVLYNDVEGDRYVCRVFDLHKGIIQTLPRALYDITPDGRFGLSLNYSRLQRLRPGYGYDALPDATAGQRVPQEEGIFLVDLQSGQQRLAVSLEQLAALDRSVGDGTNYVNHISVAPDGSRFLFFHLWIPASGQRWDGRLYTARIDGSELQCVEREFIPSHYCWDGSDRLLITSVGFGGAPSYYYSYDLTAGTRRQVPGKQLVQDGHPSILTEDGQFLSDTYPMEGAMQKLFTAQLPTGQCQPICQVYSDPRLFDEKRCDLHPRATPEGDVITFDTTFRGGKRSMVLLRRR